MFVVCVWQVVFTVLSIFREPDSNEMHCFMFAFHSILQRCCFLFFSSFIIRHACICASVTGICGVPQRSVLGLLLFLIYVNYIFMASDKLTFYLFAHDANLLYADKNLNSLETIVNCELIKVFGY